MKARAVFIEAEFALSASLFLLLYWGYRREIGDRSGVLLVERVRYVW